MAELGWDPWEQHPIRCVKSVIRLGDGRWRAHFDGGGSTNRARLLAAVKVGRRLKPTEVVHHRNGDPGDDSLENLEVFASHGDHLRRHHEQGDMRVDGIPHTPIKKRGQSVVAINLRIDPELKDRLRDAGREGGRSMNAEITYRLERSFEERYRQ